MKSGQTLVFLLVFMTMAITVTTAAVMVVIGNSQAASKFEQSLMAYSVAEAGVEEALLRILRDPGFSGATLTIGQGIATISASGTTTKTILSAGSFNNFLRQVQVTASYVSGILTVTSWQEVF